MAKKSKKWAGSVVQSIVESDDMFERPKSTESGKYAKGLEKLRIDKQSVSRAMERQRQYYADILRPYASQDDEGDTLLDFGDGWKPYRFNVDRLKSVRDSEMLAEAVAGMDLIYLFHHYTGKGKFSAAMTNAVQCVFKLGYLKLFMEGVRGSEHLLNEGWERLEARKDGLVKAHEARRKGTIGPRAQAHEWMRKHLAINPSLRDAARLTREQFIRDFGKKHGESTIIGWYKQHEATLTKCAAK